MAKLKFPELIHVAWEDGGDDEWFLTTHQEGVETIDVGQRCAIYKLVEEGTVHGPKTFVPKNQRQ